MAINVQHYAVTIPAGTASSSPYSYDIPVSDWVVSAITLDVPKGAALTMGFAIYRSGQIVLPWNGSSWFVWDDRTQTFSLEDFPTGGGWQIKGYNNGSFDHTVYTTWQLNLVELPAVAPAPTISFVTTLGG